MEIIPEDKIFKILSIDGGGIKGLYSAKVLQHLEEKFQCQISDHFDMICGTSTGGLLALGLSLKIPASELVEFYEKKGPLIFPNRTKNWFLRKYDTFRQALWRGKFSDDELRNALVSVFGNKRIGDTDNLLCIPSYCITDAQPRVFKRDHGDLDRDNGVLCVDVALATTAAPTYFPVAELSFFNNAQFIDGGVWANNPTLVGYLEALRFFVGNDKPYSSMKILSLSSLSLTGGERTGMTRNRPFIKWKNKLFEASMTGQSFFTDFFMEKMHEIQDMPVTYVRIPSAKIASEQERLIQLDVATKDALNLIKHMGDNQGLLYKKRPEIAEFFKEKKHYKITR